AGHFVDGSLSKEDFCLCEKTALVILKTIFSKKQIVILVTKVNTAPRLNVIVNKPVVMLLCYIR
ncbi:TPA: hypothetical protein ACLFL6_000199, partial [Salmonella enterica subsp. salamae serovar 50:b:z6]